MQKRESRETGAMTMSFEWHIKQRTIAWIAVFAILCHALVPSLSRIYAAPTSADATEFCPFHIAAALHWHGSAHESPLEKFNAPHCGFCVAGIFLAAPPSYALADNVSEVHRITTLLFSHSQYKSRTLISAPPRGPPTL
jgi:hypothetical protein